MKPVVDVQQVSYRYPDGTQALDRVTFQVMPEERVAVIGPNGAGKSTLFFHLNGTLQGTGEIWICGERVSEQTLASVRKNVGLVFQDPNDQLFMPTVFEDVAFGPVNLGCSETEVRERVQKALQTMEMQGTEALTPHHLSLGQRKKVALASVLAMEPKLLAFDEPSSGLDPRSRRHLIEFLKGLSLPQLIATHDLDLVLDVCQRVIVIDGGVVVGEGKVPDIFEQTAFLAAHGLERPLRMQTV